MIDWQKVTELREDIGDEDFDEVLDLFLEEVDEAVLDLRKDLADGNALERCLHLLKGSALNLGFREFSNLCSEGEKAAAIGAYHRIDLGAITESYDRSKCKFLAELKARLAA
ncbi:Hpt domain-containing protein [Rhodobacteraceae bacterium LMO-12]|nr:Hpt domain-containing protein [Rhodobacteraceae bacterium LMO-JJ12]